MKRIAASFGLIICVMIISQSVAMAVRFTSPPASTEWNVYCNKKGRYVALGTKIPSADYSTMAGPFYNEPSARDWVNKNCSSWKCDWNGRCISGTANDKNQPCPPGTYRDMGVFGQGSGRCVPYR